MYGLRVPYNRYFEWEKTKGRELVSNIYGDTFCSFNSRDGAWVIVGKKIRASNYESPILIPELTVNEETKIEIDVATTFGFKGDFHYYFIIE